MLLHSYSKSCNILLWVRNFRKKVLILPSRCMATHLYVLRRYSNIWIVCILRDYKINCASKLWRNVKYYYLKYSSSTTSNVKNNKTDIRYAKLLIFVMACREWWLVASALMYFLFEANFFHSEKIIRFLMIGMFGFGSSEQH